jgi:hypothetical protein
MCRPDLNRMHAIKHFDSMNLFRDTLKMDVRGVSPAEGVVSVRTTNLNRVQDLTNGFLYTAFAKGPAKVLVMDDGKEEAWRPYTVSADDVEDEAIRMVQRYAVLPSVVY